MSLRIRVFGLLANADAFLGALRVPARSRVKDARSAFEHLGFLITEAKSPSTPTRSLVHLGFEIDSDAMTFRLAPRRLDKFRHVSTATLTSASRFGIVPARLIARVVGHVASAQLVLRRDGRIYCRFLNDAVRDAAAARRWSARVAVTAAAQGAGSG